MVAQTPSTQISRDCEPLQPNTDIWASWKAETLQSVIFDAFWLIQSNYFLVEDFVYFCVYKFLSFFRLSLNDRLLSGVKPESRKIHTLL